MDQIVRYHIYRDKHVKGLSQLTNWLNKKKSGLAVQDGDAAQTTLPGLSPSVVYDAADAGALAGVAAYDQHMKGKAFAEFAKGNAGRLPTNVHPSSVPLQAFWRKMLGNQPEVTRMSRQTYISKNLSLQSSSKSVMNALNLKSGVTRQILRTGAKNAKALSRAAGRTLAAYAAALSAVEEVKKLPSDASPSQRSAAAIIGAGKTMDDVGVGVLAGLASGIASDNPVVGYMAGVAASRIYAKSPWARYSDNFVESLRTGVERSTAVVGDGLNLVGRGVSAVADKAANDAKAAGDAYIRYTSPTQDL